MLKLRKLLMMLRLPPMPSLLKLRLPPMPWLPEPHGPKDVLQKTLVETTLDSSHTSVEPSHSPLVSLPSSPSLPLSESDFHR